MVNRAKTVNPFICNASAKMRFALITIVHKTIEKATPGRTTFPRKPPLWPDEARPDMARPPTLLWPALSKDGVP